MLFIFLLREMSAFHVNIQVQGLLESPHLCGACKMQVVDLQAPEYVLDRLAIISKPQSQSGERRLKALAFLAALIHLHAGRHQLRMRAREGLQGLADRVKVQASDLLTCL